MRLIEKYRTEAVTALVAVLLCFSLFLAWNEWLREPKDHTINPRLQELKDSLAQSRMEKDLMEAAYQDSMQLHQAELQTLLADTNGTTEITERYDEVRNTHRNLSVDSSAALAKYRLRIESEYGQRFDYDMSY
jgi:flagellar biosynthesis component FlhA